MDTAAWALRTALPQLSNGSRVAAALLLAEVLQEQGRWADSALVLDSECKADSSELGTVFSILATHKTTPPSAQRILGYVQDLEAIVRANHPPTTRLKAASAAAQMMDDVREATVSQALLDATSRLPEEDLTEDQRVRLELCRAQFLYYAGRQQEALERLTHLASYLRSRGIANSTLVRIHGGLGALRCYQGKYDDAKAEYLSGYALASRIGNEPQQTGIAGNLALCCMRLGEYEEQLRWNSIAGGVATSTLGYQRVQTAFHRAFGLAMLGDSSAALQAFDSVSGGLPHSSPPWLVQAWRLHRADILLLCGHQKAALAQGREGVELPCPVLRAPSLAGAFARWLANASSGGEKDIARRVLSDLSLRLNQVDTLDRVEVICASWALGGQEDSGLETMLRSYVASLPAAAIIQLQRLGALQTNHYALPAFQIPPAGQATLLDRTGSCWTANPCADTPPINLRTATDETATSTSSGSN